MDFVLTSFSQQTGTFIDTRDGKEYKTVTIGKQTMLDENFAFKPAIGNYWANSEMDKFGYFYDWETAKTIAPVGWHLPTKEEWKKLEKFMGKDAEKSYNALNQGGSSGFNALLAGIRSLNGTFGGIGRYAIFWSATALDEKNAWNFLLDDNFHIAGLMGSGNIRCGFSVRFFKD